MLERMLVYLRFVGRYFVANLQGALEYRVSFISQVFAMLLNDLIWLIFWLAYFSSFPLVAGWIIAGLGYPALLAVLVFFALAQATIGWWRYSVTWRAASAPPA